MIALLRFQIVILVKRRFTLSICETLSSYPTNYMYNTTKLYTQIYETSIDLTKWFLDMIYPLGDIKLEEKDFILLRRGGTGFSSGLIINLKMLFWMIPIYYIRILKVRPRGTHYSKNIWTLIIFEEIFCYTLRKLDKQNTAM